MKKKKTILISEQDLVKFVKDYIVDLINKPDSKKEKGSKPFSLENLPSVPDPYSANLGTSTNFEKVTGEIIDNFEGGYYHPKMKERDPDKFALMGDSGETMFGIDRKHGSTESNSPAGKEFWNIIDSYDAKNKWKYLYRGENIPGLTNKLKKLVSQIMEPRFIEFQNTYLSPEAKTIVNSNPKIYFHFAYATWNGPGFFQKWAKGFNEEVKKGKKIPELVEYVLNQRKNYGHPLIARSGRKMEKVFQNIS